MIGNNSFGSIKASTTILQKLDVQFNQNISMILQEHDTMIKSSFLPTLSEKYPMSLMYFSFLGLQTWIYKIDFFNNCKI